MRRHALLSAVLVALTGCSPTWQAAPIVAVTGTPEVAVTFSSYESLRPHGNFDLTGGLAVDAAGRVYSGLESAVLRVSPAGSEVFAGDFDPAHPEADGPGGEARFQKLGGMAMAPGGDLFVADTGNAMIRRITSDGVVSTFAHATGDLRLNQPVDVAVEPSGALLVADVGLHQIMRITPDGVLHEFSGAVASPSRLAPAPGGGAFVIDMPNEAAWRSDGSPAASRIVRLDAGGQVVAWAPAGAFDHPSDLDVDAQGRVYVADYVNRFAYVDALRVQRVETDGNRTLLIDHVDQAPETQQFKLRSLPPTVAQPQAHRLTLGPDGSLYVGLASGAAVLRLTHLD